MRAGGTIWDIYGKIIIREYDGKGGKNGSFPVKTRDLTGKALLSVAMAVCV